MRPIASILVIDDNAETLETLGSLLSVLGTKTVCQAESAERALEILKTESFSLIISDYMLEGMNGIEFLEQLRAQGNQTPILLLSGAPDKAGVLRATSHQNVDFFGKPFQMAELMGAVERLAA